MSSNDCNFFAERNHRDYNFQRQDDRTPIDRSTGAPQTSMESRSSCVLIVLINPNQHRLYKKNSTFLRQSNNYKFQLAFKICTITFRQKSNIRSLSKLSSTQDTYLTQIIACLQVYKFGVNLSSHFLSCFDITVIGKNCFKQNILLSIDIYNCVRSTKLTLLIKKVH